jgi:hypothetical protein
MRVIGCMGCGSTRLDRKRLFAGPVVFEHEPVETARCLDCGVEAVPLVFRNERALERYRRSLCDERSNKGDREDDTRRGR